MVSEDKMSFFSHRSSLSFVNSWTIKCGFGFPSVQQKDRKSCSNLGLPDFHVLAAAPPLALAGMGGENWGKL